MSAAETGPAPPSPPGGFSGRPPGPRDIVTDRVTLRARHFPDLAPAPLDTDGLDARDRALARAIDQAVARRWLTLVPVIASRLSQPWDRLEAKVKAPLLVGAAQLLLLDRLPDHAVINSAVQWTKWRGRGKASGLVNAVLRRVAGLRTELLTGPVAPDELGPDLLPRPDGGAWRLTEPVFSADPLARLAEQTSHPRELLEHWINAHGHDAMVRIAMHDLVPAPIIVAGLPDDLPDETDLRPHRRQGFHVFTGHASDVPALLARLPGARVQDPGTAAAVAATNTLSPSLIVDACAGRGTKTWQLAALHPDAKIVATDIDPDRHATLADAFAGHPRVSVVVHDQLAAAAPAADLLVLDVPCTNTGVLARRVEARYRFGAESLASLVDLQRQIMADTLPRLAAGGHLLYATCSIEPAENERQVGWLEKWHGLELIGGALRLPEGGPGDPPEGYADGGYHALLRRGSAGAG